MSPRTPPDLAELLGAIESALDREDADAAAEAVAAAVRACAELAAAGVSIAPARAAELAARTAQLERRAVELRDAITRKLGDVGRSRRATAAYGRR